MGAGRSPGREPAGLRRTRRPHQPGRSPPGCTASSPTDIAAMVDGVLAELGVAAVRRHHGAPAVAGQPPTRRPGRGAAARPGRHRRRRTHQRPRPGRRHPVPRSAAAPGRRRRRRPGLQPPPRRGRPRRRPHQRHQRRPPHRHPRPPRRRHRTGLLRPRAPRRRTAGDVMRHLRRRHRRRDPQDCAPPGSCSATTVFLVVGIAAIATGMTLAARSGNADILAKLGPAASHRRLGGPHRGRPADHRGRRRARLRRRAELDGRPRVRRRHRHRPVRAPRITGHDRDRQARRLPAVDRRRRRSCSSSSSALVGLLLGLDAPATGVGALLLRLMVADRAVRPHRHARRLGRHPRPRRAARHRHHRRHHRRRPDHGRRRRRRLVPVHRTRPMGDRTRRGHPAQLALVLVVPAVFGPLTCTPGASFNSTDDRTWRPGTEAP